jgi:hypothetical protein
MVMVPLSVDLHEETDPGSYTTHPPIWMVQQWEENAPREDPQREALVVLGQDVSPRDTMKAPLTRRAG